MHDEEASSTPDPVDEESSPKLPSRRRQKAASATEAATEGSDGIWDVIDTVEPEADVSPQGIAGKGEDDAEVPRGGLGAWLRWFGRQGAEKLCAALAESAASEEAKAHSAADEDEGETPEPDEPARPTKQHEGSPSPPKATPGEEAGETPATTESSLPREDETSKPSEQKSGGSHAEVAPEVSPELQAETASETAPNTAPAESAEPAFPKSQLMN